MTGRVSSHLVQMEKAVRTRVVVAGVGALARMASARRATASSPVAMASPPRHGIFFPSAKLNTPTSPNVPTCRPCVWRAGFPGTSGKISHMFHIFAFSPGKPVLDDPPVNGGVIHLHPTFFHEFFDMARAQPIRHVPTH